MFELNQLEQLITIAEAGTVSKAAELLHLSQPALSRSIQRLEEELQVSLFDRQKNKITLNANGELALEYARKILSEAASMSERLQTFERSQHTLSLGSCAPAPLWRLTPTLSRLYPDMTIQSEIKTFEQLTSGLLNGTYQIIITTKPSDHPDILSFQYLEEHLYVALPPAHPLAVYKNLSLRDLNGQSMLILSKIGFWYDICKAKMPDSLFLVQEDIQVLDELRRSSALPSFSTNLANLDTNKNGNRVLIPLTDSEVNVTFYCHIKNSDSQRLERFVSAIENS
ncbi:LysR family transcriptional regulator [Clostridium sp. Marseille-P299]|uniref:LysR family transcriptional regulator n=1 Tax=Clostridium sp. Marseille-P299 TaxID=1805477 RepID=UPI00082E4838|nr:LysR family transcriptional regulator [Clostridium sp. Marseille-P299]